MAGGGEIGIGVVVCLWICVMKAEDKFYKSPICLSPKGFFINEICQHVEMYESIMITHFSSRFHIVKVMIIGCYCIND